MGIKKQVGNGQRSSRMEENFIGSQGQQWNVVLEKEEEENDLNQVNCVLSAESTYERCLISTVVKAITIKGWVTAMSSESDVTK